MSPRYKDSQDAIDNLVQGMQGTEMELREAIKKVSKGIMSSPDLSKDLKKQKAKTIRLDQLHSLYAMEQWKR